MRLFRTNETIDRLNRMIDNAIEGKPVEDGFDETKISALETKLSHYLASTSTTKAQLSDEKKRINELISDISHQTKTPVANILLYAQILDESILPEKERQCVQALTEQAEKLNFLIASLVKASRLETGVIAMSPKPGDIQPLLDDVIRQSLPKANVKGIALTCEKTDSQAIYDPKWTAEAIYNIVENAIKYTPSGGTIHIRVLAYELFVRIDITDTGIGISEANTAKIFTRFYRAAEVSETEGVGIGLYLAREIITGEGGYIKVQSELGKGSTFSIFLSREARNLS